MNIQDKWGTLYPGLMLMVGAPIEITPAQASSAMLSIETAYGDDPDQLYKDLEEFIKDQLKEDAHLPVTPLPEQHPINCGVGEKLHAIWQGSV